MREMVERGSYNTGRRSGGHKPGETSFLTQHGGSIPHNLIAAANTKGNSAYRQYCTENDLPIHPAQFSAVLPALFIRMLTDQNDVVLDPFAGSCVTGEVAERMGRKWICCEISGEYVEGAKGRFGSQAPDLFAEFETNRTKPYAAQPPSPQVSWRRRSPAASGRRRHARLALAA